MNKIDDILTGFFIKPDLTETKQALLTHLLGRLPEQAIRPNSTVGDFELGYNACLSEIREMLEEEFKS